MDPENLIQRFAQELEFGVDEHRIAKEALTILSRMNRDWMVSGRRPAGVCGAAIILAARMNNYRRTVREVVYTAKIGDATIQKRLDEFMVTESSGLTVTEFKHHGKDLEKEHDPPSYYRQFESKPKRRKRKRKEADEEDEEINDDERDGTPAPTERGGSATPEPRAARGKKRQKQVENAPQKTQTDSEIMPPPPIPIDPTLLQEPSTTEAGTSGSSELVKGPKRKRGASSDETEESTSARQTQEPEPKRKRGRPAGSKNKPLPELDEEMIRDEEAIEEEINHLLEDSDFVDTAEIVHREQSVTNNISDNPEIDPTEFEDDREVANCLLTEAEIRSKELLWVNLNSDWLRKQQKRRIRDELAKKAGTTPVVQTRKRRRARMGDMSQYVDQNGNQIVFKDAKEATAAMMAKRGFRPPVISKKINYDKTKTGGYFSLTENLLPPRPPRRSKKTNSTETSRSGSAKATTPSVSGRKEAVSITSSPISSPLSTPSRTPTPDLTPRSSRAARASTPAATKAKATRSAFAPRGTSGSSRASSRASTPAAREPSQPPSTAGKAKATTKATKKAENELASFVKEGWVSHSDDEVEEEEEEEEDYEETEEDSEARYQEEFDAYGGEEV